ncbi:glycosyltransferase [Frigoriglobus tundricola]|uniref:GT4 family glycosyltransferase n=1 Tax=Frigoriglobus tundricola TaxID=2774151 RepID=A0A6M5YVH0_9BACT|nr:glycosyltransferase [Frigoriglobus tundricola]QJW98067.1 GT4 family glycosyltransferase [Frigoriglobus tundricola]
MSPAVPPDPRPRSEPGRPLHIAHGVLTLDVGGLERIVLDLVRVGRRQGHRVSVICLERPGTLAPTAEAEGATVVSLGKPPGRRPELVPRAAEVLRALGPDVIHTHAVGALWYLGRAARTTGRVPTVHTEHIDNVGKAVGRFAKLKTRLLWNRAGRFASAFCGVSEDVSRSVGRWGTVPRAKVHTVLNGIDLDRYDRHGERAGVRAGLGIPPDARVIGTVGRLNEVKRQDHLIRALGTLGARAADVRLLLVGDGPERGALERLVEGLGLSARVHFAGYQSAPERFLPAMDVFALSSRLEGLPLALLEAWAAGLPVVSSAVGGVPKVVRHGETGLLFPNGDEPALARALLELLDDPAKAARLAAAGRAVVRRDFSLERMASEYEGLYRAAIAAGRGGG